MYLISLAKSVPKPVQKVALGYFIILVLLEVFGGLHSKLLVSRIYRLLLLLSFFGVLFIVVSLTLVVDIQRKDTVVEEIKGEIVRLYVKLRPEAEPNTETREAKWDLITKTINEYVQKNVDDVDADYRKILKFDKKDIKEIFNDYMKYISRKILREYRSVDIDLLGIIDPWDRLLLGVRNMYLEDLKLSFSEHSKHLESHIS